MTKNFLPIFRIELPTIQTKSKSSEKISSINTIRVLEFKKEKKGHHIMYSFVGVVTVYVHLFFFYAHFILRVMICQPIAGLWEFSFLNF